MWRTVPVRGALVERIESYLQIDKSVTSVTQFCDLALREKLDKQSEAET